jgi:predicted metal-binding membrane protein
MLPSLMPVLWRYYQTVIWDGDQTVCDVIGQKFSPLPKHTNRIGRFDSAQRPESATPVAERRSVFIFPNISIGRINGDRPGKARRIQLAVIVGLGYFFVWALVGTTIYPVGVLLARIAMRSTTLAGLVPLAASVVVLIAGALQFTAWKERRLDCCQTTRQCHLSANNLRSAWSDGVRLGIDCCSCCVGLTAILCVIGIMDLRAMALVTLAITIERLVPTTKGARIIGSIVISAGLFMTARIIA